jgi:hypothetical protein
MIQINGRVVVAFNVTLEVDEVTDTNIIDELFPNGYEGELDNINCDNADFTEVAE